MWVSGHRLFELVVLQTPNTMGFGKQAARSNQQQQASKPKKLLIKYPAATTIKLKKTTWGGSALSFITEKV